MKIIEGGDEIVKQLSGSQLTSLKQLIMLKIEESFADSPRGGGIMVFDGVKQIFKYDCAYVEFFFDREKALHGTSKVILYNGLMPDEVLECISKMKKETKGLKTTEITKNK